ncbi:MAG TPA: ferredoxin reductase [Candidatus Baltobacteraceae bacterium]|jgi:ferredoxin-NADP reductase|nr:ferredoxin reductase [Candidatus Baltobacteraceae bacterium]
MAGTTVHGRLNWHAATVAERRKETDTASTLVLDVSDWPGHVAGQHVDVRLRADDGYTAVRTYSIANAPNGDRIELSIELMPEGEVSPYLVETVAIGGTLEVLGPIGGWFVWKPEQAEPVQLVAGGSGIVPLMSMIRTRNATGSKAPFRLLYSVRTPQSIYYANELQSLSRDGIEITYAYTRETPPNSPTKPERVGAALIASAAFPADRQPTCYICGPTSFVEAVAALLTQAGHDASRVKTERFGPTGTG